MTMANCNPNPSRAKSKPQTKTKVEREIITPNKPIKHNKQNITKTQNEKVRGDLH
ncbi:hypothetical protein SAICODRAFT_29416 [Saitoella complicata NRRL Y-17804]|uniref:uncharacterized protein n=1 Tax=Saitoella complicata (strain BCRC 22490 / CBS 7301 / JCM 7358 / NBRC 10748 / NRRL Y-17804) TaxID=698492 RepID=UPI000866D205|nr:uncharacterized protein SAICODRAFT_29416 [Saitoella complicata NRRL Y-17804]ODQ54760.1 hypothetical protein SAICODRAFT_29416 [Saitoella complicata NRRL Y-17804]